MVKARGPSKGANWLAKERGLSGPRFTTSCSRLFEENGDPWLTNQEQDRDYPLNRSRAAEVPLSVEAKARQDIYEKARVKLESMGVEVPKPNPVQRQTQVSVVVDPDMDMFTKALRAEVKPKYIDPEGKLVIKDWSRWRANLLLKTKMAMSAKCVDVKEAPKRKEKIKGNFYVFNPPDKRKS